MSSPRKTILFTALEPSGDAHAASVIAHLVANYPEVEAVAWGGPRMEAAGARMLGRTADDGVMGIVSMNKVLEVKALHDTIVAWVREHPVAVHMPVDSPSANYPLCARLKPLGARVVNLVAPQLWAWAPWRIGKVRRLSDVLLCLLPFEEEWFRSRGVVAKYVGHPVLSKPLDDAVIDAQAARLPAGAPRIVLLPGSRSSEVRANSALLVESFALIRARHANAQAVVVASNAANAAHFVQAVGGKLPAAVTMITASAEATIEGAIRWSELALAVSGTVSLDCTRQATPMIGVYRANRLAVWTAKIVIRSPHLLLPNIIAGRTIVPEFVPYAGRAATIAQHALAILDEPSRRGQMIADLRAVAAIFTDRDPAPICAETVARAARGEVITNETLDEIVRNVSTPRTQNA
jgi:lipid-A-disaccharide synthase